MALQQVCQDKEPGFATAGAADDQHVLIPRVGRIYRPVGQHQAFRLCQDDVLPEIRIHKRLDILRRTPAGRSVLLVFPEFLGVLASDVYRQSQRNADQCAKQEIRQMKTGKQCFKSRFHSIHQVQKLLGSVRTFRQPPAFRQFCREKADERIRDIQDQQFFQIPLFHLLRS